MKLKTALITALAGGALALAPVLPASAVGGDGGGWFGAERVCVRGTKGVYVSTTDYVGSNPVYVAKNTCKKMGRSGLKFKHVKSIYVSSKTDIRSYAGTPTGKWKYLGRKYDHRKTGWGRACPVGRTCATYNLIVIPES